MLPDLSVKKYSCPAFKGLPVANYTVSTMDKSAKKLTVYLMEPKDSIILECLLNKIKHKEIPVKELQGKNFRSCKTILKDTLETAVNILKLKQIQEFNDKSAVYLAVTDKKPCGIVIGNMPKLNKDHQISYSNRNVKGDSEIDWLVSWNPDKDHMLKGTGKILVSNFFHYCKKLNVKNIFVRSEIPSKSQAKKFYENMSFHSNKNKTIQCDSKTRPNEITNIFFGKPGKTDKTPVYPMETDITTAIQKADATLEKFNEELLKPISVEPHEFVDLE